MTLNQKEKYRLSMVGEYGVCSELSKRGYDVSLTMGNAKAVDVFVFKQDNTCRRIEVKTSRSTKFVTGFFRKYYDISQSNHPDIWILVHIDTDNISHYYILTHQEMGDVQMQRNGQTQWQHNPNGVDNVLLKHIQQFEDQWNKI